MVTPDLSDYIRKTKQRGVNDDTIKGILKSNGWSEEDINEAYGKIPLGIIETVSPLPQHFAEIVDDPQVKAEIPSANEKFYPPIEKKSGAKKLIILMSVIFLCLGGAAAFGYFKYQDYFKPPVDPETQIFQAFFNLRDVSSVTLKAFSEVDEENTDFKVNIDWSISKNTSNSFNQDGVISLSFKYTPDSQASTTSPYLEILSNKDLKISFDTKLIDRVFYLRLKELPEIIPLPQVDAFKKQWIKIDQKEIQYPKTASSTEYSLEKSLTKNELDAIFQKHASVKKLNILSQSKEKLQNVPLDRYTFKFTNEIKALVKELITASIKKQGMTEDQIKNLEKDINQSLDNLSYVNGEIWVGEDELSQKVFPYRIVLKGDFVLPETSYAKSKNVIVTLDASFSDFNKEISIEAPEDSKTFQEILESVMGQASVSLSTSSAISTPGATSQDPSSTSSRRRRQ